MLKKFKDAVNKISSNSQTGMPGEIQEFHRAKACIVSFPKCGRTWLRVMIGKALCDRYGLDSSVMLDELKVTEAAGIIPTLYTHDGSSNMEGRHWKDLTQDKSSFQDKKVIFLLRDPRDVVVSCFFQATKRKGLYNGTISDFIRDDHYGIRKIVIFYNHWYEAREIPKDMLVLSYERMSEDPASSLRKALEFMGATEITDAIITNAVEFSRFDNMQKMEAEGQFESRKLRPADANDLESFKVRRGKVGGFVDYLSDADQQYCNNVIRELGCPFFPL
jgi:hypothetical protein